MSGYYRIRIICASAEECVGAIIASGIKLERIQFESELEVCANVNRSDYASLKEIVLKRNDHISIVNAKGFNTLIYHLNKRFVLLLGTVFLITLTILVPTRIFFISVEGNRSIPDKVIIEQLQKCNLHFGAGRKDLRSEIVKNSLMNEIPELQWVGVNTTGCVAVITVKERSIAESGKDHSFANIIAGRDGIIKEMTVTKGNPLCKVGSAVRKGQILVSAYTDLGGILKVTGAEAEILAQTVRTITAVTSTEVIARNEQTAVNKEYAFIIGKKLIKFWNSSGISDTSCVKIEKKYILRLPGGFPLPVTLIETQIVQYSANTQQIERYEGVEELAKHYVTNQMVSGRIQKTLNASQTEEDTQRINYIFSCLELIGNKQYEEIVKNNE